MKVLVGLSGGIDSCVTAHLLKKEGYDVEGVTMLIWKKDSPYPAPVSPNSCYSPARAEDKVHIAEFCRKLGIPYTVLDCSDLYESTVLGNFRSEYMSARTPNPCVWCNEKIKFGVLLDYAREMGIEFDKFATGHYARITYNDEIGRWELRKAVDEKKDQSYFLYRLSQKQLSTTLFPLGTYLKSQVREIDVREHFHEEGQAESQDFYGGDYSDLLNAEDRIGDIVNTDGKVLGHHKGFWHYTIGQRRGLGIAAPQPLYVLALDSVNNRVIVGYDSEAGQSDVYVDTVNWTSREDFSSDKVYQVKIRSASRGEGAYVRKTGSTSFEVHFLSPVKGVTAGQSCVVYDGDLVVAGGIIESSPLDKAVMA